TRGTCWILTGHRGGWAARPVTCFWITVACAAVVRLVQTLSSCADAGGTAASIAMHTAAAARRLRGIAPDPASSIENWPWLIALSSPRAGPHVVVCPGMWTDIPYCVNIGLPSGPQRMHQEEPCQTPIARRRATCPSPIGLMSL